MFVILSRTQTIGVSIVITSFIGLDTNNATRSVSFAAIVFGVISPNINIKTVIIAVAITTPRDPNILTNRDVDIEVAAIFARLLPTNIALNNFPESSVKELTNFAPLIPSSFIYLILILLKDISEVSDAEKNADVISSNASITIWTISLGDSNLYHTPNYFVL